MCATDACDCAVFHDRRTRRDDEGLF